MAKGKASRKVDRKAEKKAGKKAAAAVERRLSRHLPRYRSGDDLSHPLPARAEAWTPDGAPARLQQTLAGNAASWPKRRVFFISDPHADAEAFEASLVASGGVSKTGSGLGDFTLTGPGRKGRFIIGGDCLDKGPSNLAMLRSLQQLIDSGARVTLLAGNHDMRLLMGLMALERLRSPRTEHLFVRMGHKVIPLLQEVHAEYLDDRADALSGIPSNKVCRRRLFPRDSWFETFPAQAESVMPEGAIDKELARLRKKVGHFEAACSRAGLSLRQVYAAALKLRELFLHPKGEFAWFFQRMCLAHREGAFLFVHAGLDDRVAGIIATEGVAGLNRRFDRALVEDPCGFYYGALANTLRTKYRRVDFPLTEPGVASLHKQGLHVVVHGHINLTRGQQWRVRSGMLHLDGDITLDRHSRRKEGLSGPGMGATLIHPAGQVIAISSDYPHARVFDPAHELAAAPRASSPKSKAASS
ncbi:metallophosphoesterase [Halomonas almeriensis]|uniref:metallophosphoesterase n=1 Tax=Halomonas almeriensis TaxID=308163 RepID=UPI0025B47150|nr:metallophosphoesterase [Halomonas almeriensis]MDN3553259.1 metallophosphoesterase [Halomonas almeriensis]